MGSAILLSILDLIQWYDDFEMDITSDVSGISHSPDLILKANVKEITHVILNFFTDKN